MGKQAFTNEQIVRILEEGERTEENRAEFCRRQNISEATYYAWRKKFYGMQIQDVRRLKELEMTESLVRYRSKIEFQDISILDWVRSKTDLFPELGTI